MRQLHRTTCTYPDLYLPSICASLARMVTDSMWLTGDAAWCVYNVVFLRLYGMGLGGVFRAMDIFWDEIPAWWILCFFTNNRPPIRRVDNHLPSLFPEPEEKKRKLTPDPSPHTDSQTSPTPTSTPIPILFFSWRHIGPQQQRAHSKHPTTCPTPRHKICKPTLQLSFKLPLDLHPISTI